MKQTLRCQAALIQDLPTDGFDFVLTARLQSNPPERIYSQYSHMSGGLFLVSVRDVMYSENILKLNSLVQEGINGDDFVKLEEEITKDITGLLITLEDPIHVTNALRLFRAL